MTIEIGDKVRIVAKRRESTITVGEVGYVTAVSGDYCNVLARDGLSAVSGWHPHCDLELVTAPTTVSDLCKENMEAHMAKGRYVQAIKWAQMAELAKKLEEGE